MKMRQSQKKLRPLKNGHSAKTNLEFYYKTSELYSGIQASYQPVTT